MIQHLIKLIFSPYVNQTVASITCHQPMIYID